LDRSASGQLDAEIVVVARDCGDVSGLAPAERAGIPSHVVDSRACLQREIDKPLELELPVNLEELTTRRS
jgi:hypothetical protein